MQTQTAKISISLVALIGSVLITVIGGVTSYFNALSEIKKEIAISVQESRRETRELYAGKEEVKNIQSILQDIKTDLKLIQREVVNIKANNEFNYKFNSGRRGGSSKFD